LLIGFNTALDPSSATCALELHEKTEGTFNRFRESRHPLSRNRSIDGAMIDREGAAHDRRDMHVAINSGDGGSNRSNGKNSRVRGIYYRGELHSSVHSKVGNGKAASLKLTLLQPMTPPAISEVCRGASDIGHP
jgi:hypothetical protein